MSAPARLLGLRVQGFKSFADRTLVEFGEGISAVVGPNGSGKSNLADALRWALGEQGRSLRIRKSEDVIWAGSERRAALGMADVTLVLDNADALLPVEYSVVELGRRLYRSGENDYLLNRQRVRLRDLVDLLDSANLAENAFLFIGQGMVDQALALRPEERRPLFEEVAGVRRHERRRRKAERAHRGHANLARGGHLAERPLSARLGHWPSSRHPPDGPGSGRRLTSPPPTAWHQAAARVPPVSRARPCVRVRARLERTAPISVGDKRIHGRARGGDGSGGRCTKPRAPHSPRSGSERRGRREARPRPDRARTAASCRGGADLAPTPDPRRPARANVISSIARRRGPRASREPSARRAACGTAPGAMPGRPGDRAHGRPCESAGAADRGRSPTGDSVPWP